MHDHCNKVCSCAGECIAMQKAQMTQEAQYSSSDTLETLQAL